MKISEYRHIARKNLKGCYCEAFIVTALCLFVYLSFKAAELLMAYFWSGYAGSLISGLLKAAVTALCFLLTTPFLTGGFRVSSELPRGIALRRYVDKKLFFSFSDGLLLDGRLCSALREYRS